MGEFLSTDIVSPQVLAAGGQLTGGFTFTSPAAGNYYLMMEQYTSGMAPIPGSRAYLFQTVPGGSYVNSTINFTVLSPAAAGVAAAVSAVLTLPNSDCQLYVFVKEIPAVVVAGAFVAGTTYKIVSIGTTDFTLVGAAANTVGLLFTATGVGAGTGTVCTVPDPDTDDTIDYVVIAIQSSAAVVGGLDVGALMNLMITMMIVVMMMKMMVGAIQGV